MNALKQKWAVVGVGTTAMFATTAANAAWVEEVKTAVTEGFQHSETVATAVIVGFAVIFAIGLAKRVLH